MEYKGIKVGDIISPKLLNQVKVLAIHREENRMRESRQYPIQPNEIDFVKIAAEAPDVLMFLTVI
jgi:hypothetical protein